VRGAGAWLYVAAAVLYTLAVAPTFRPAGAPSSAVVTTSAGEYLRAPLPSAPRRLEVPGPLGTTTIKVAGRRARVTSSPCPNHICVRRGWLAAVGDAAVCVPNRVAVRLE